MKFDESIAHSGVVENDLEYAPELQDPIEHVAADGVVVHDILENSQAPKEGLEQHIQKNRYSEEGIESCPVFKEIGEIGMKAVIRNVEERSASAEQFRGISVTELLARAKKASQPAKIEPVIKIITNMDKIVQDTEVAAPEVPESLQDVLLREQLAPLTRVEEVVVLQHESITLVPEKIIETPKQHQVNNSIVEAVRSVVEPNLKADDMSIVPAHIKEIEQASIMVQEVPIIDTRLQSDLQDIPVAKPSPNTLDTAAPVATEILTLPETVIVSHQPEITELPSETEQTVDTLFAVDESTAFNEELTTYNLETTPVNPSDSVQPRPFTEKMEAVHQTISSIAERLIGSLDIKSETVIQELEVVFEDIAIGIEATAEHIEIAVQRLCEILLITPDDVEGYNRIRYILEAYVADITASLHQSQSLHILNTIGTTEYKFHAGWKSVVVGRGDYNRAGRFILNSLLPRFA